MRKIPETYKKSPIKEKRRGIRPTHMIILFWVLMEFTVLYVFNTYILMDENRSDKEDGLSSMFFVVAMFYVPYMLPSIIGRNRSNGWSLFMINFFSGWTGYGWFYAFLSCMGRDNGRK